MTDQVNPLGSLAPGMAQTLQAAASLPSKPPPKPVEPKVQSLGEQADEVSKESPESAAKDVQKYFQQTSVDIKYSVDKETGTIYFKLIDPATQKVIRQIPSEEVMAMSKRLRELSNMQDASGILMDKEG
jgi:uncharacterized FlaG/YvyC family protein